ncbi:MAG: cupin domain-containing protein [Gammaproteobacteria bacterium]
MPTRATALRPYDLDGVVQTDMALLSLSYDRESGKGAYLMRMEPGAMTVPHEHRHAEEFMVLEGELIDDDGARFGAGDYVVYESGTFHNSRTETGCLLLVFEWSGHTAQAVN